MLSFAGEFASPFANARPNSLHIGDAEAWKARDWGSGKVSRGSILNPQSSVLPCREAFGFGDVLHELGDALLGGELGVDHGVQGGEDGGFDACPLGEG